MESPNTISILLPAFNEETILKQNVSKLISYLQTLEEKYNWEILIINDGSVDRTGQLADQMAANNSRIRVFHHHVNLNLGHALRTGFSNAQGDGIIVMDLDLSYSPDHIRGLANTLFNEHADIVIASPYMPGGKSTGVPKIRLLLSKFVNRIMSMSVPGKIYTFTGMVRAYKADFIKNVNLKTKDYQINPEILYKAMILRARILEIPAHLDWTEQNHQKDKRTSKIKIGKNIYSGLSSCFIFRPYIYFMGAGFLVLLISLYVLGWIFYHTITLMPELSVETDYFDDKFSHAVGIVFNNRPHAFLVGGFSFVVSVIILGIGFLSLQTKRYFEELFHLGSFNQSKK